MHRNAPHYRRGLVSYRLAIAESKDCFDDDGQPEDQLHPHFTIENGSVYLMHDVCWMETF